MPNVSSLAFFQLNTLLFQLNDVCCEKCNRVFFLLLLLSTKQQRMDEI